MAKQPPSNKDTSSTAETVQVPTAGGPPRPSVHMILQKKGGAGKSVIASLLAQWLTYTALCADDDDNVRVPMCIDTDPLNKTFNRYDGQGFNVTHINIMNDDAIDSGKFDTFMEMIFTMENKTDVVIDTGSSNFIPLIDYIRRRHVPAELDNAGFRFVVHTVITGGASLAETLNSIDTIAANLAAWRPLNMVVWENPYYGPIQTPSWSDFSESQTYKDNATDIRSIIKLPKMHRELEGRDFAMALERGHTFDAAIGEPTYPVITRRGLTRLREKLWHVIDEGFAKIGD